jgi:hypothetical protein
MIADVYPWLAEDGSFNVHLLVLLLNDKTNVKKPFQRIIAFPRRGLKLER